VSLRYLRLKDFAIFDEVEITFAAGLNALTGESGSGKSLALEAIRLLVGARAAGGVVRSGAPFALLEAVFDVGDTMGDVADEEGQVILSRQISDGGRSLFRLNGQTTSAQALRELGPALIDQVGQGEGSEVLDPHAQRRILDHFAGNEGLVEELAGVLARVRSIDAGMAELGGDERSRERQISLLDFQIREIDEASLASGEEEEIRQRRALLAAREGLMQALAQGREGLLGGARPGAYDLLARASEALERFSDLSPDIAQWTEEAQGAMALLADLGQRAASMLGEVDADPGELDRLERRLLLIEDLKRKYGKGVDAILAFRAEACSERERLMSAGATMADMQRRRDEAAQLAGEIAGTIRQRREAAAPDFERRIEAELGDLGFDAPRFFVRLVGDDVTFDFQPNPGEAARPLAQIASGGEQSRVLLALKAFEPHQSASCVILDEVDTGLGGDTVRKVAERLKALTHEVQVLAVTHQAAVAAVADHHVAFTKRVEEGRTFVAAATVTGEDRVQEIARMLAGSGDTAGVDHARSLLAEASS